MALTWDQVNQGVNMPVVWCILNGYREQGLLILDWRNGLSQSALSWHVPVKLVKKWCTPQFPYSLCSFATVMITLYLLLILLKERDVVVIPVILCMHKLAHPTQCNSITSKCHVYSLLGCTISVYISISTYCNIHTLKPTQHEILI